MRQIDTDLTRPRLRALLHRSVHALIAKEHPPSSGAGITAEKFSYEPKFIEVILMVSRMRGAVFGM